MKFKLKTSIQFLLAIVLSASSIAETKEQRIISAGGSVTEIIYKLGIGKEVIAVDTSSFYPDQVNKLPKVGYFRALSAEGILSLEPTLLIAARGAGPKAVLGQISGVGTKVKVFEQDEYTLESWQALVREVGSYFDKKEEADVLIGEGLRKIEQLKLEQKYKDNEINAVTLLSIGQRGPIAAGRNTMPDLLFTLAGLNNIAKSVDNYKSINTEVFAQSKIDLIFIPSHVANALGGKEVICENQAVQLSLRRNCNLIIMDGLLLMGMGARLDKALEQIIVAANKIHSKAIVEQKKIRQKNESN